MRFNIAIDGPAGAGKSTAAKALAKKLNFDYIDTGAMYRTVALLAIKKELKDEKKIAEAIKNHSIKICNGRIYLDNIDVTNDIKSRVVTKKVSSIARIPAVRESMLKLQQKLAIDRNVVMDGRDIGTVILPNAKYKFFLTADVKVRAKRRYNELIQQNQKVEFNMVLNDIIERDKQDTKRSCSPLKIADDAIVIDTTNKTIKEVVDEMIEYIKRREGDCFIS